MERRSRKAELMQELGTGRSRETMCSEGLPQWTAMTHDGSCDRSALPDGFSRNGAERGFVRTPDGRRHGRTAPARMSCGVRWVGGAKLRIWRSVNREDRAWCARRRQRGK
jgi:hypothetical protein